MHDPDSTTGIAGDLLADFTAAQMAGDRAGALGVAVRALRDGATTLDVYVELIEPAQAALGIGWARGALTVADEHMATAVTQHVVSMLHARTERRVPFRGRLLVTGVEGEAHQLGSQIVADALAADGWSVRYLGSDAPLADVADAIIAFDPSVVGISVTMLANVAAAAALIEQVRRVTPAARILVGGGAFSAWDEIWRSIGADARGGDVRHAIITARRLQARRPRAVGIPA